MTIPLVTPGLDLRVHSGAEFVDILCRDLQAAGDGDRIAVATMSLDPEEPAAARVVVELCAAARRGAAVTLALDAYTMRYPRRIGPLLLPRALASTALGSREKAVARLRKAGVRCVIVNGGTGGLLGLYAGRSHLKIAVITDRAYVGGPSLHGCDGIDLVVAIDDRQIAGRLHALVTAVAGFGNSRAALGGADQAWSLGSNTQLLLDAGISRRSSILEYALGIIDAAQSSITIACQYVPTGIVADRLAAAHRRDVDVCILFNHPHKHDQLIAVHRLILAAQRLRRPSALFTNQVPRSLPKLHAKALASETTAMVGSHNLAPVGVRLGTSEIAVVRTDPAFAKIVRNALHRQLRR